MWLVLFILAFFDTPAQNGPISRWAASGLSIAGETLTAGNNITLGVDYDQLEADLGITKQIAPVRVSRGQTAAEARFDYSSPDPRPCQISVSSDGLPWTGFTDSGGARSRQVTLPELRLQAVYQYRIVCYGAQTNDGFLYTDYSSDQITNGTFTTFPDRRR